MLAVALVDRVGSGLWAATSVLYFTYVAHLGVAQVGTLVAAAGIVGIAGAPAGGLLADRLPVVRVLAALQLLRTAAAVGLLLTHDYTLLLICSAAGGFGDRASSVLTKLYASRIAGPERVRYQAVHRTVANAGWAVGGLGAAAALSAGTTTVYTGLLLGDALSFVAAALIVLRCAEVSAPARTVTGDSGPVPAARPTNPWRDRMYLAYVVSETVLFLDDAVFRVGLPLWAIRATDAPHGLVPLLLVLNSVLVVALQVPLARFGATTARSRALLLPLGAVFAASGVAMAASAAPGAVPATIFLTLAATGFTLAEMLHATVSWELSIALAPDTAQGAYLGVHGLAQATQRAMGPLAVTAAIATGPLGWTAFGTLIATTCAAQHRLVRARLTTPAPSREAVATARV
ncbi:MFS transporter [Streptomyces hesseae]|uniref:MFS transporter n=1 Tax=Streptomyces hesseae TaxID=3075519 RepID=A0ABU2SG96_9ACTN|nr:MFS transporter [Streptomyces sp. DSM 40473]MDT0447661.1 MFS transporter [Streptomyces sp. DSM 40473]